MLANSFLGPIASRCMLLSPHIGENKTRHESDENPALFTLCLIKSWVMVQKVTPFTVKLLRKRWFLPFSTSLFQAFRSSGQRKEMWAEKKWRGEIPLFFHVFQFPALFLCATLHYPIQTPETGYLSTKWHLTLAVQAIRKGGLGEEVMVIRCSIWKLGPILLLCIAKTIVKIANLNSLYRKTTIISTFHSCKYLKDINASLIPRKTKLQETN